MSASTEELQALKTAVAGHESETRRTEEELHGVRQELESARQELGTVRQELSQRERLVSAGTEELEALRDSRCPERAGAGGQGSGAP